MDFRNPYQSSGRQISNSPAYRCRSREGASIVSFQTKMNWFKWDNNTL